MRGDKATLITHPCMGSTKATTLMRRVWRIGETMFVLTNVSEDECGNVYAGQPLFFDNKEDAIKAAERGLGEDFGEEFEDIEEYTQVSDDPYILSLSRDGRFEAYTVAEIPEPKQIKVQTPGGELIAEAKGAMDEYPGFYIYQGTKSDMLAVIEYGYPDKECSHLLSALIPIKNFLLRGTVRMKTNL